MEKHNPERAQEITNAVLETLCLPGDLAEAGVSIGISTEVICKAKCCKPLHLFDTFEGLPESMFSPIDLSTDIARYHLAPGMYAASLSDIKEKLKIYENVYYYPGIFPETAESLKDKTFSFVHLDLDLYKSTIAALNFFYPRLNKGGIIMSHNYTNMPGVTKAFDEFFKDKPEKIIIISSSSCFIKKL